VANRPPPTVEFRLVEDLRLVTVPMSAPAFVLAVYVAVGAAAFSVWEGWSWADGVYFCFVSLMTIGFGDFVPGNGYIYQVIIVFFFFARTPSDLDGLTLRIAFF